MKKLLTLFAMLTLFVSMMAQTPFNYQAVLRDPVTKELVRNQTGTAQVYVKVQIDGERNIYLYGGNADGGGQFMTNADGMVNLQLLSSDEMINWSYVDTIFADFTYGESTISLVTPVAAVPYAFQADAVYLTTENIEDYLGRSDGEDLARIYQAMKFNSDMHDAARDSIVEFIMAHFDIAKDIAYHYFREVTREDVREFYEKGIALDQEVQDSIYSVVKQFLKENRAMMMEVAKYYAKTATADEVNELYQELLTNESASAKVRSLLNRYFNGYLHRRGLYCNGVNICDLIAELEANNETTTQGGCPSVSSNIIDLNYDNLNYTATIVYTGGSADVQVTGTYGTTNTPMQEEWIQHNPNTNTINLRIPKENAEVGGEATYLHVTITISDGACADVVLTGDHYLGGGGN